MPRRILALKSAMLLVFSIIRLAWYCQAMVVVMVKEARGTKGRVEKNDVSRTFPFLKSRAPLGGHTYSLGTFLGGRPL